MTSVYFRDPATRTWSTSAVLDYYRAPTEDGWIGNAPRATIIERNRYRADAIDLAKVGRGCESRSQGNEIAVRNFEPKESHLAA